MKFAKDIYDMFSRDTLPFLQERYGIDEYKAVLKSEYLKQTRQLVFDLETSDYRRKITKERVTGTRRSTTRDTKRINATTKNVLAISHVRS